ncbi:unnamed protein product [Phytophthora fragariaefolia]|uniref:Unnamed protein product n=1 Tax=Phytophthora fragariaefolia TaxID=1490495 RepID=A0A9W6TVN8_9STRA|nr:unnamed protein product [Phytophthora fragariaefolia]
MSWMPRSSAIWRPFRRPEYSASFTVKLECTPELRSRSILEVVSEYIRNYPDVLMSWQRRRNSECTLHVDARQLDISKICHVAAPRSRDLDVSSGERVSQDGTRAGPFGVKPVENLGSGSDTDKAHQAWSPGLSRVGVIASCPPPIPLTAGIHGKGPNAPDVCMRRIPRWSTSVHLGKTP